MRRHPATRKHIHDLLGCVLTLTLVTSATVPVLAQGDAAGALDPTFGTGGRVTTDFFDSAEEASAVAIQPDGKIVAAGLVRDLNTRTAFALARYNTDGSLDSSFGTNGRVTTSFPGTGSGANAVVIQPDGKIVAVGYTDLVSFDRFLPISIFALARYNADGTLDATFGVGGRVTTNLFNSPRVTRAYAVALQSDGKIVAVGNPDFVIVRYNTDGSLDSSFGTDGRTTVDFLAYSEKGASAVALQHDGKIVVAGYYISFVLRDYPDFALARLNVNGSLDSSFGSGGRIITGFTDFPDLSSEKVNAVAIQPDGKIIAVGNIWSQITRDLALARYNIDGSLDISFGVGGKVTTDLPDYGYSVNDIALQHNGKIVVAGGVWQTGRIDFAIVRYNTNGSLDSSFGTEGIVFTDFFGREDQASAVAIQPDGRIVAAGYAILPSLSVTTFDFALARYAASP